MIFEFAVTDKRYHSEPVNTEIYYATNDFEEAKLVANEVGFNFVIVRYHRTTDSRELAYDARFNTELALEP